MVKATKHLQKKLSSLIAEIRGFKATYEALKTAGDAAAAEPEYKTRGLVQLRESRIALRKRATDFFDEGMALVPKFERLLQKIVGKEPSHLSKPRDIMRAKRLLAKDKEYSKLRERFTRVKTDLTMLLVGIEL